jgi:centrosomal protein CEP350
MDTSLTEEEMERSLRDVLPSEGQRKKLKRASTSGGDVSLDDSSLLLPPAPAKGQRRLSFEEDSFSKFTVDMVKQYMREEEIRAHHQVGVNGSNGGILKLVQGSTLTF